MNTFDINTYKGDTWNGIKSVELLKSGVPIVIPDTAKIYMQIKTDSEDTISVLSLSTDNGTIDIIDGPNGKFRINPIIVNIAAGSYVYDVQINFSSTEIKTYLKGNFTVVQDVTVPTT